MLLSKPCLCPCQNAASYFILFNNYDHDINSLIQIFMMKFYIISKF